jgi:hypothetical protein
MKTLNNFVCSYAGIGTRDLTIGEHLVIGKVAKLLANMNVLLYSGNAPGSDQAFQKASNGKNIVFIPWDGFEQISFDYKKESIGYYVMGNSPEGQKSIDQFHPAPMSLSRGARSLMARNYHQIVGTGSYPTVSFVVCCADPKSNNEVAGGTGQAVRIANSMKIPVFNIRADGWQPAFKDFCLKLNKG